MGPAALSILVASVTGLAAAQASDGNTGSVRGEPEASEARPSAALGHPGQRHHTVSGIDERVRALAVGLDLDPAQQAELKRVLQEQREQTLKVWSDPATVPAAYRIAALKAISEHTADRIRALLNDEQRKKYNPPARPPVPETERPDVAAWVDATTPHVMAPGARP